MMQNSTHFLENIKIQNIFTIVKNDSFAEYEKHKQNQNKLSFKSALQQVLQGRNYLVERYIFSKDGVS